MHPNSFENAVATYPSHLPMLPETCIWSDRQLAQWRSQLRAVLKKSLFLNWLLQFPSEEIVGYARNPAKDPVANYLQSVVPWLDCEVGWNHLSVSGLAILKTARTEIIYLDYGGEDRREGYPEWLHHYAKNLDSKYCFIPSESSEILKNAVKAIDAINAVTELN